MSADFSRQRFNPLKDLSGVLMQQGRVQLDADWNEFVEILDRRFRAETTDIIGRSVVPKETPDGFKITVSGNDLNIGPGRIYVDGILAENHGDVPIVFDAVLGELRGSNPVLYSKQPYLPSAKIGDLTQPAPLLVYIDVWEREVTFIQDPDLVEKAVGVDATARVQTIWQVKVLPNVGNGATCTGAIPGWDDLIKPSGGRLSTAAHGVPLTTDPCLIPPVGGYLGLENQLYRVEIHDVDAAGNATFKWSRENASVATNVRGIDVPGTGLTVDSVGRDSVLCFKPGDWIEITDDVRELNGLPGVMRKIQSILDKTITLSSALAAADLPDPAQHARIRRWDHSHKVFDNNNQTFFDLDASTTGVIPVPPPGTSLLLENGVQVTFSLDPAGGKFHVGDYWLFAARTADASVEELKEAAPRGIHHHYGRLAIVTLPNPPTDCRVLWPPEECCDCSVCVTAESHNNGRLTIQQAIDQIKDVGGTVCLGPGLYYITSADPVRFDGAKSVRIKGQSWFTILLSMDIPGVLISNSARVTVEDLSVVAMGRDARARLAVVIMNSAAVTIQRCAIIQLSTFSQEAAAGRSGAAIALSGFVIDARICDNAIYGADGVAAIAQPPPTAQPAAAATRTAAVGRINLTALLRIDDNFIFASGSGVNFDTSFLHLAENRIAGNFVAGCHVAGIEIRGTIAAGGLIGSRLDIHGNVVSTSGHGVVVSTDETRITDNDISASTSFGRGQSALTTPESAGILLAGRQIGKIEHCQIFENRINRIGGSGVSIAAHLASAMIKQNIIDGTGHGGIMMTTDGAADVLTIENNQILNVATGFNNSGASPTGISVVHARQIAIAGNAIIGLGLNVNLAKEIIGIGVTDSISARIAGNTVYDIALAGQFSKYAEGIVVTGAINELDVLDNDVKRNRAFKAGQVETMNWYSLLVRKATSATPLGSSSSMTMNQLRLRIRTIPRLSPGPETIAVRDNFFDGYGSITPVLIQANGACLFGDNRCNYVRTNGSLTIAQIDAGMIIASANFFEGPKSNKAVILNADPKLITVLGNIASGLILVKGIVLQPPWASLNIRTP